MPLDDATLRITVTADASTVASTMNTTASVVQSSADRMAVSFKAANLTIEEASAGMKSLGFPAVEASTALAAVGYAEEEVAAKSAKMVSAMGAARVEMGALEGSAGMMAGGLARVAAQSEVLAPLIQAAFVPFALAAFADIAVQAGEKLYTLYQNIINNKAEFEALDAVEKSVTETQDALVKSTEAAYVSYLRLIDPVEAAREKLRSLSSERFTIKIDDKELKEIPDYASEAGLTTHKLLQMFTDFPASQVQQKMQDISTIIGLVQQRLAASQLRGPLSREELEKELEVLQKLSGAIAAFQTDVANQQRLGGAEVGKAQDEQAKEELKKLEEQAREREKLLRSEAAGEKQLKEDLAKAKLPQPNGALDESTFAGYYEKMGDAATAAFQNVEAERNKESAKIAAESYVASWKENLTSGMEAASASIKNIQDTASLQKDEVKHSGDSGIGKAIQEQNIAAGAYEQTAVAVRSEQDAIAALSAAIYTSGLPLEQQLQLFSEVESSQNKLTQDAVANDQRRAQSAQQAAEQIQQSMTKAAQTVERSFQSNFDSVIRGTESVKFAFIRTGGDIVLSVVHTVEQNVEKWIAGELAITAAHLAGTQTQVATTTTAAAQTRSINAATSLSSIAHSAASAAAKAYEALAGIPIIGPALGAAAAAATFAGVMAFEAIAGSAQQGAVVPQDMAIFAHAKEMILPRHLSEGVQNIINTNGGGSSGRAQQGGGDTHIHANFSAIDGNSVQNFFRNNQGQLTKVLRNAARNGVRMR